jgi:hypothetical protein
MDCTCFIVPRDVLERLAHDPDLSSELRGAAARTMQVNSRLRALRSQAAALCGAPSLSGQPLAELAPVPSVTVYDCKHNQRLPGTPVAAPGTAADATARRTFDQTTRLADFYREAFGRNSIDDAGLAMMSSIHFA